MPRSPRRWPLVVAGALALVLVPVPSGASPRTPRPHLSAVAAASPGSVRLDSSQTLQAEHLAPATSALPRVAVVTRLPAPVPVPGRIRPYYPWFIPGNLADRGHDPRLGHSYSAEVIDSSGSVIWSRWPHVSYMPASTNKLITAYVALKSLGGSYRIDTTTLQDPAAPWYVYLKGGGDPSLTSTRLRALAASTATAVKAEGRTAMTLRFDDTLFPAPTSATGWKSDYVPGEVAPVRPLVVDSHNVADTAKDAASAFASMLTAQGITVRSTYRTAAPSSAVVLATTSSDKLQAIVARMLNVSQNDYAEILYRLAAHARGRATSWTGARQNAHEVIAANGIPSAGWVVEDGSGLSRSDRVPADMLVRLLRTIDNDPSVQGTFFGSGSLPVAGVSGTLSSRFRTAPTVCARGIVHAKTGSLSDATALAGLAIGLDGQRRYFAVLDNYTPSTSSVRTAIDVIAATSTGCF